MREAEAQCPACRVKNERGKPPVIKIDGHNLAWCSQCGEEWEVKT